MPDFLSFMLGSRLLPVDIVRWSSWAAQGRCFWEQAQGRCLDLPWILGGPPMSSTWCLSPSIGSAGSSRSPLALTQLLSTRLYSSHSTSRLLRAAAIPLAGSGSVRPHLLSPLRHLSEGAVRSDAPPKLDNNGRSDKAPAEMGPLFPCYDYMHWLIVMDKPGSEGATKQQMINCYIQTLAKIVGRRYEEDLEVLPHGFVEGI